MKRFIAFVIIVFVFDPYVVAQPVYFADPDLKVRVEATLGVSDPTANDMLGLTELQAFFSNISDLKGLEYATNLEELILWQNQISDISPLAGLTNLERLELYENQISDISPLAGLTKLEQLDLYDNQISDISPLAGLTNLEQLDLGNNPIGDISPLAGLTEMRYLYLSTNDIIDISPLSGMMYLYILGLQNNQINDISPLGGLTNLLVIYLADNQISNISPLGGLTNLEQLDLSRNQISDISPLGGLTNLRGLRINYNPLNPDAFDIYIPQIEAHADVYYGPTAIVPYVVGMRENDADSAITSLDLGVSHTYQYSDTVPAGDVISQEPVSGKTVGVGFFVRLTISLGPSVPDPVVVPDVVGMTQAAATSEITSAGLVVGIITGAYSDTVAEGHVISQNPAGGTSVPEGFYVHLIVSLGPYGPDPNGPGPVEVPDVVGMSADEADSTIISAGLEVSHSHLGEYSDTVPEGHIIRQYPSAGTTVAEGSYVELTVSRGPRSGGGPSVPVTPGEASLLAHWKLDETSGTTAMDSSGNGHHGKLYGNPKWMPNAGWLDGALDFDGFDDYVDLGNDSSFDLTNEITLAVWVNANDMLNGQHNHWLGKGDSTYAIKHHAVNYLEFFVFKDGTYYVTRYDTNLTSLNGEWHHMAGTFDGSKLRFYLDGKLKSTSSYVGTIGTSADPVTLGENSQTRGRYFEGMLDDARIYDRALNDVEISALVAGAESTVMLAGRDIGTTGGSDLYEDGIYTIMADGSDIGLDQDEFRYVYSIATGDFEISARVLSLENVHPSAKAGVMIRETLEAGSRNVFMCVTPEDGLGRLSFQSRSMGAGEMTTSLRTLSGQVFYPFNTWLKIIRQGSIFTAFTSEDGIMWEEFPGPFAVPASNSGSNPVTMEMPESVYVGLAVTSHSQGVLCSAEFDNVVIPTFSWPEMTDITTAGDVVRGVPNDGDWPPNENPGLAIDDNVGTKYLHFKGDEGTSGLQITPAVGATVVMGLTFTTANEFAGRDPVSFELYGSNGSIDGPYTLIVSGDIVDFNQGMEWPRFTMNSTMIAFENLTAYKHYELLFTAIRGPVGGSVDSMQIAEIELLGIISP